MTEIYVKVEADCSNFEIDLTGTYPKIHLRSKPHGGRANSELLNKLSSILGDDLRIVSGHKSKRKKIKIADASKKEVLEKLKGFVSE